jgi:lipoprotein-releasing system permease protein
VVSAVPLIEQPLAATYNGRAEAVLLRGMRESDIRELGNRGKLMEGSLARITPDSNRIAIGSRLAESLGATVGSQISLFNPQGSPPLRHRAADRQLYGWRDLRDRGL